MNEIAADFTDVILLLDWIRAAMRNTAPPKNTPDNKSTVRCPGLQFEYMIIHITFVPFVLRFPQCVM